MKKPKNSYNVTFEIDDTLYIPRTYKVKKYPDVMDWCPRDDQIYFIPKDSVIIARWNKFFKVYNEQSKMYLIRQSHLQKNLNFIVHHLNYYLEFYDEDKELLFALFSIKYIIDTNPKLNLIMLVDIIKKRILTDTFVARTKQMAKDLYTLNIDKDDTGKFTSTPKITDAQARAIVAVSFAIKFLLPTVLHYSNINQNSHDKKSYIKYCDKIFTEIIDRFEENDENIYNTIGIFMEYRINKSLNKDSLIWTMKAQIRGDDPSIFIHDLIHEMFIVKNLYKLDYRCSLVSFIDGISFRSYTHFKKENFPIKPIEIEIDPKMENSETLNRIEAIEMQSYRLDESNIMISNVNIKNTIERMREKFKAIPITEEEYNFYKENWQQNEINQFLLSVFYSKYFHDPSAIFKISKDIFLELIIYLKKFLKIKGMIIIPQVLTAKIIGKYKENIIRNKTLLEKSDTSDIYVNIIKPKFRYITELKPKDNPILKYRSAIINSTLIMVDPNPKLNGIEIKYLGLDAIVHEYWVFMAYA